MILCWAIGCAASRTKEFYLLPEKESSKGIPDEEKSQEKESGSSWRLMQYDSIAINVIVGNKKGGINSCDIPYSDDIQKFNEDYLRLTSEAAAECKSSSLEDAMVVGTSAMIGTELDSIVNQHTDKFCNPVVLLRTKYVARDSSEIHFFQVLGNAHAERTEKKREPLLILFVIPAGFKPTTF